MVVNSVALAPITLVHGSEEVLADRALSVELEKRNDYERTILDGGELVSGKFAEVIAPSLFAEKRVVVIRAFHEAPTEIIEEIETDLEALDPNVHLIFIHGGGNKAKGFIDRLKKAKAQVISCEPLKKVADKESFIKNEFAEAGRRISSSAVTALIDATGSDMRELAAACRQIAFDVSASKEVIDDEDIANFYQGRVEASGFDVADAAIAGDTTGALIALRNALDTGTDPVMIIAATASSVRTLAKVAGEPRNANPYQLASKLGLAPWQIEKARKNISRWSPQLITFSIQELAAADVAVKGGESDPIYAVERCILAIAGKVAGKASV